MFKMKYHFRKISIYLLLFLVLYSSLFQITAECLRNRYSFYDFEQKVYYNQKEPTCEEHPENVKVQNVGSDGIKFSWERPACWNNRIVQFEVLLTPIPSKCTVHAYSNKTYVKSNFLVIHKLLSNIKYNYSIQLNKWAFDTGNQSISTNPELPRNIQTKNIMTNGFKISWTKPESWLCNNFRFEISLSVPNSNFYNSTLNQCEVKLNETKSYSVDSTQNEYEIKGLLSYVEYKYWFQLNNTWNSTNTTNLVRTKPSVPEKVENVSYNVQQNKVIRISWKPPCRINGNFSEFLLNVAENTNQSKLINHTYRTKDNFYDLENITSSTNYVVSIQGVVDSNIKGQVKNITVNSGHIASDPPQNISVSEIGSNSFSLSWNKPRKCFGNIKNYNIHLESLENMNCLKESYKYNRKISADDFYTNFDNLLPNSKYNVKMKVITESGDGDWSPDINFQTAPEQKKKFALTNIRVNQQIGSVDLNWSAPCHQKGPIKNFSIKINGIYSVNDSEIYTMSKNVNFSTDTFLYSLSISDLIPSCNYTVQIFVISVNGIEENFLEETFSLDSGIPEPPSIVELNATDNCIILSWKNSPTPVGEIVKYQIYIIPPHNYCNKREVSDVEVVTDINQTYYTVSIAASTGENRIGLPRSETGNVIYGLSSDDYDASLILEEIAFCKQSKAIKRFDIIIERNYNETDVKIPDNSNEFLKSHFQLKNQYETVTNYTVRIQIQTKNGKGKIDNDSKKERNMKSEANESSDRFLVRIVVIIGVFGFIIIISLILFKLWKKKILNFSSNNISAVQEIIQNDERNILLINVDSILHNSNKITEQFEQLVKESKKFKYTTEYALLPGNRKKNRYRNMLPFDSTRVQLKIEKNDEKSSDYINASFIKGFSGNVEYIATQGPLRTTCKDFWKMVFQKNVTIIVMLTQFEEKEKEKCFKYFPNNQETLELSDDFKIRCAFEINFKKSYCVRRIQIQAGSDSETVYHIQFLNWPDLGVPSNIPIILEFLQDIRQRFKTNGGLIAVHCSAGVGRTGTLIAADILLQTIKWKKPIDIYKIVLELRMQRCHMVQTSVQYQFIHSCINEALKNNNKPEIKEDLSSVYQNVEPMSGVKKNVKIIYENAESIRFLETDETNF